jgi:hypothetical protein
MTAHQQQLRRDTAANVNAATPAAAEPGWDTTEKELFIGDGSTLGGIKQASANAVQNSKFTYGTVTGTGDEIDIAHYVPVLAYTAGLRVIFKAGANNTGAVDLDLDGLGDKDLLKMSSGSLVELVANDIRSGGIYEATYDGTQFQISGVEPAVQASGLVYLGTYTASASSSIDITSKISSTYDDYVLILDGINPDGNNALYLRTSTDNGSSWDSGGSDYKYAGTGYNTSAAAITYASNGASQIQLGAGNLQNNDDGINGTITLYNVNNTTKNKNIHAALSGSIQGSDLFAVINICGARMSTANIDAVRLIMSSGNIADGTVKIYGISKS